MSARKRWFKIMQLGALAWMPGLVAPIQAQGFKLTLAPDGNEARFVVQEQLAQAINANDAIGKTKAITGSIVFDAAGKVDTSKSRITADLASLTSDRSMRDNYIKNNTLQTSDYPNAVLVPVAVVGLANPIPTSGEFKFSLIGHLTVHGVTKPTTWEVTATMMGGNMYMGTAKTHVKFEDFGMTQPRVSIVLSVVDDIRLEYDFHFVKGPADR